MLTVYLVLLLAIPSVRTVGPLGSIGRPAIMWGLLCFAYWCWVRVTADGTTTPVPRQPLRVALLFFLMATLVSYVTAHAGGALPPDEASPSDSALVRSLSWAGVLLVANDGITSATQLRLLTQRIALVTGLVAVLGLAQFISGDSIVDRLPIPGLSYDPASSSIDLRSGYIRAVGTASHPLEYAVVISAGLPLAISLALLQADRRGPVSRWWPSAMLFLAAVVSVSKSAVLGLVVGVGALLPGLPRRSRAILGVGGGLLLAATYVLAPGMMGTLRGLFLSVGEDSSSDSRRGGLRVALEIAERSLPFGRGPGTFIPTYYVLDNQLMLLLVEVGVVGLAAFMLLVLTGLVQSQRARRTFGKTSSMGKLAHALTASVAATATLFAFFDALSFVMAAGMLFLLLGLCGAAANIAVQPAVQPAVQAAVQPAVQPPMLLATESVEAGPLDGMYKGRHRARRR